MTIDWITVSHQIERLARDKMNAAAALQRIERREALRQAMHEYSDRVIAEFTKGGAPS